MPPFFCLLVFFFLNLDAWDVGLGVGAAGASELAPDSEVCLSLLSLSPFFFSNVARVWSRSRGRLTGQDCIYCQKLLMPNLGRMRPWNKCRYFFFFFFLNFALKSTSCRPCWYQRQGQLLGQVFWVICVLGGGGKVLPFLFLLVIIVADSCSNNKVSNGTDKALGAIKENPDGAIVTVTVLGFGKFLPIRYRLLAYGMTAAGWAWRYPDGLSELAKSVLESVPSKD